MVAGAGGAGSSTFAARLALGYAARGRPVVLIGADPVEDATSMIKKSTGSLRLVSSSQELPGRTPALGPLLDLVGLDPRLAQELGLLSEASGARLLCHLATNVRPHETVVIDAGRDGVDLVRLAGAAPWILQRLAPAQRGWLGASRPLLAGALGARWPGAGLTRAVQEAGRHAAAAGELLLGQGSATVVVAGTAPVAKGRRFVVGLGLNAAPVTAVLSVEPDAVPGVAGWVSGVDTDVSIDELDRHARVSRNGDISWERAGESFVWRMPLPGVRPGELSLSMILDDLVLNALGHRSVMTMPTVLRRCAPQDARVGDGVLTVRFTPVGQDETRDRR